MEHMIQVSIKQEETHHAEQPPVKQTKPRYQPPRLTVFGTVAELTKGSGGEYSDECTSGKQPADDE